MPDNKTTTEIFEEAAAGGGTQKFILSLFVAGMTPKSLRAIENAKQLCEIYLKDRCELEVVDVYQQPSLAKDAQVIAAPTLVKRLPLPLQRFIGDLSDPEPILVRLALKKKREFLSYISLKNNRGVSMEKREPTREEFLKKIRTLEERLCEAEQTIQAIRGGEVDAFIVHEPMGEQIYTLKGADHGYRVLIESITEGALILSADDSIYYCNRTLGEMLGLPIQKIISRKLDSYVAPDCRSQLMELIKESRSFGAAKGEFLMKRNDGALLPVNISFNSLSIEDFEGVCAVITDLSEQKRVEEELRRHRTELQLLVSERTTRRTSAGNQRT